MGVWFEHLAQATPDLWIADLKDVGRKGWLVSLELCDPATGQILERCPLTRIDRQGRIRSLRTGRILKEI